jgi:hypothetical protein
MASLARYIETDACGIQAGRQLTAMRDATLLSAEKRPFMPDHQKLQLCMVAALGIAGMTTIMTYTWLGI